MKIKKKIAFLSALALMFSGIASGISNNSEFFNQENIISASAEEVSETDWKTAYADFLSSSAIKYDGSFCLAYIDNDDIPELLCSGIVSGSNGIVSYKYSKEITGNVQGLDTEDNYEFYSISENKAVSYLEKGNLICVTDAQTSGKYYYIFAIDNNEIVKKCTINFNYINNMFSIDDKEVTEEECNAKCEEYSISLMTPVDRNEMYEINYENIEKYLSVEENTENNTENEEATDSGKCGENVDWAFYETTGTLTISGSGDMYNYGGLTVAGIDAQDPDYFKYADKIKNLIIEDGVTSIGNGAFNGVLGYYDFENVTIADSVKTIGNSAFAQCNNITKVLEAFSTSKVENVGEYAFHWSGSSIEKLIIPETVKIIDDGAFAYTHINAVVFPENLSYKNIENARCGYDMEHIYYGTYYGYKDSDAEKFVKDMDIKYQGNEYYSLKFIALDEEQPAETNPPENSTSNDNSSSDNGNGNSSNNKNNNTNTNNTNNQNNNNAANNNNNNAASSENKNSQSDKNSVSSDKNKIEKADGTPSTGDNGIAGSALALALASFAAFISRRKK